MNTLLIAKMKSLTSIGNHIEIPESRCLKLAMIESNFEESLKVAILLSSSAELIDHSAILPSISTLPKSTMTRNYVSMIFIEDEKRLTQRIEMNGFVTNTDAADLASSSRTRRKTDSKLKRRNGLVCSFSSVTDSVAMLRNFELLRECLPSTSNDRATGNWGSRSRDVQTENTKSSSSVVQRFRRPRTRYECMRINMTVKIT